MISLLAEIKNYIFNLCAVANDSLVPQLDHGVSRIWKDVIILYYPILELTSPGLRSLS